MRTIVAHIEMIVRLGEELDVRPFLPSPERIKNIRDAFKSVGDGRLTPVKQLLGDEYSYEEIRLVRAHAWQQVEGS